MSCLDGLERSSFATHQIGKLALKFQLKKLGLLEGRQAIQLFAKMADVLDRFYNQQGVRLVRSPRSIASGPH